MILNYDWEKMMIKYIVSLVLFIPLAWMANAGEHHVLTLKDHQFTPALLTIPANTKVEILIRNLDKTPEEFESEQLGREKVVPAGGEVKLSIGPLTAGTYTFVGEFHEDTAKGKIVVE